MNVAVLTFIYADNYGALLQAYALKKIVENAGNSIVFLDYIPESEKKFYEKKYHNIRGIKEIVKKTISNIERRDSAVMFDAFRNKNFLTVPYREGLVNNDLLIVGSDQVWNEKIVKDLKPYLFSEALKDKKKISYAASIGKVDVTDTARQAFKEYLKWFSAISLRENSSKLLLESLGFTCRIVVDPVFLLTKNQWITFCKRPSSKIPQKYVFAYLLRNDEMLISKANKYAHDNKLKLIYVHPMGMQIKNLCGTRIKSVGPEEFVWLINNANAVFTNSFHAISFCCIFNKEFCHVQRSDLGNRVSELLSDLNVHTLDNGLEKAIYGETFLQIKDDSFDFLKQYIGRKNHEEERD